MVAKINAKKANQAAEPGFPLLKAVLEKIRAPTTMEFLTIWKWIFGMI